MIAFACIARNAEHLAVLRYCLASLRPWLDVVASHFLVFEVVMAERANALLFLVRGALIGIVECP